MGLVEYSADATPPINASSIETAELLESFYADLRSNRFTLTSIPEVALKIRKLMDVAGGYVGDLLGILRSEILDTPSELLESKNVAADKVVVNVVVLDQQVRDGESDGTVGPRSRLDHQLGPLRCLCDRR